MSRIVLPSSYALGCSLRRLITGVEVANLIAPVVNLVVPVVGLVIPVVDFVIRVPVIPVVVVDLGVPVAPVVITPVTAVGRGQSIADIGVIVTGAGTGVAGVAGII
jgi:hypothetical protein